MDCWFILLSVTSTPLHETLCELYMFPSLHQYHSPTLRLSCLLVLLSVMDIFLAPSAIEIRKCESMKFANNLGKRLKCVTVSTKYLKLFNQLYFFPNCCL